jgi:hypothetical protein
MTSHNSKQTPRSIVSALKMFGRVTWLLVGSAINLLLAVVLWRFETGFASTTQLVPSGGVFGEPIEGGQPLHPSPSIGLRLLVVLLALSVQALLVLWFVRRSQSR